MPPKPTDYSKTEIYKIIHENPNETFCYVGSTTNFNKRKWSHKSKCSNDKSECYNYNLYKTIRANGGWDCFRMVLVEAYPCNNSKEAYAREQHWIKELSANLNMINAYTDRKEYEKEYKKEYYETNKEKINKYHKKYRDTHKEEIKEYHKEYRDTHKEEIKEYNKERYENNKGKRSEKIECECGSIIRMDNMSRHCKTIKHKQYIQNN